MDGGVAGADEGEEPLREAAGRGGVRAKAIAGGHEAAAGADQELEGAGGSGPCEDEEGGGEY